MLLPVTGDCDRPLFRPGLALNPAALLAQTPARSVAAAMKIKGLPPSDDWTSRRMHLITHHPPRSQTPLGTPLAHLQACAAGSQAAQLGM